MTTEMIGGAIEKSWKKTFLSKACSMSICAVFLSGCSAILPSLRQPDRIYPFDDDVVYLNSSYSNLKNYTGTVESRNELISARMYEIDVAYTKYESQLTHENQQVNFGSTALTLGLTTAGSLILAPQTTRVLSGLASGITGLDNAYSEKIILSKTIQNVQTQMRANRNDQAALIYASMRCSLKDYPIGMALSDLESYYRAGTFTAGLINLSKTVAKAETEAKANKEAKSAASSSSAKAQLMESAAVTLEKAAAPSQGCPRLAG